VLADAFKEAGCADTRTLVHLRSYDARLRECRVIGQLLGNEKPN
jgi:hypothetical protein